MAVTVTHATVTAVPDDPAYDIGSDEWNAAHSVSGLGTAAESAATDFVAVVGDEMTGTLTSTLGTITTSKPAFSGTQTWNAGGVTFSGWEFNVDVTASAAASTIFNITTSGGTFPLFTVDNNAYVYAWNRLAVRTSGVWQSALFGYNIFLGNTGTLKFADATDCLGGTPDSGVSRAAAGVVEINNGTQAGAGALQLAEMTAPAGTANCGRIYCEDNGAGKTRLMVQFGSGAAQQIAIEP